VIKVERVDPTPPSPAQRVFVTPPPDSTPPEPIRVIIPPPPPPPKPVFKAGDYVQWVSQGVDQFLEPMQIYRVSDDGEWAGFAHSGTYVPTSQLVSMSAPALPESAETITLDIERLCGVFGGAPDMVMMEQLNSLPEPFRKTVLKTHALTHRPVTVWRVGESEWRIK
jgi:hypothetical protein